MTPKRIQRKRTKGWKMPPNTEYVGHPTIWGNPFQLSCAMTDGMKASLVKKYEGALLARTNDRAELEQWFRAHGWQGMVPIGSEISSWLRGKNLACWCPLDQPCHADVLLELANPRNP